jgi:NADH-quinone oxidoreductase subunit C
MADDQKPPSPTGPPTPPLAAADKPGSGAPVEPVKGEVSRTGAGAGASAVPAAKPADLAAAPEAANPAAAPTAATTGDPKATGRPPAAAAAPRPATAAKPAAAPPKPGPPAGAKPAAEHPPKAAAPAGPPDQPPPADQAPPAFIAALQAALPGAVIQISYWVGDWTIIVAAAQIVDVARHLHDGADAAFDLCSDVTASDWPSRAERFDVIYCLYSTRHHHRVRVKARVAEHQPIASVTPVWPAANWLEREVFDMFGVNFTGHPDRRRILMPEDWQGHPQRKDYPLEGPGELLMENPIDWLKLRQARDEADIE